MKAGTKIGLWAYWYENGQKWKAGDFKAGAEIGLWTYWYENRQKWKKGDFKNGVASGLWTYWNHKGQKLSKIITGDSVNSVAFSPDGKTLASGCSDGTIRFWDVP